MAADQTPPPDSPDHCQNCGLLIAPYSPCCETPRPGGWRVGEEHECPLGSRPHRAGVGCARYAVDHGDATYGGPRDIAAAAGPDDPDPVTRARRRAAADEIRKALAERHGMVHLGPLDSATDLPWLLDTARRVLASVDALDRGREPTLSEVQAYLRRAGMRLEMDVEAPAASAVQTSDRSVAIQEAWHDVVCPEGAPPVVEVAVEALEASHRRLLHAQGLIGTEIGRVSLTLRRAHGAVVPDPDPTTTED